jgi:hypothetical protein
MFFLQALLFHSIQKDSIQRGLAAPSHGPGKNAGRVFVKRCGTEIARGCPHEQHHSALAAHPPFCAQTLSDVRKRGRDESDEALGKLIRRRSGQAGCVQVLGFDPAGQALLAVVNLQKVDDAGMHALALLRRRLAQSMSDTTNDSMQQRMIRQGTACSRGPTTAETTSTMKIKKAKANKWGKQSS